MKQRFKLIEQELKRRPGPVAVPTFLVRVEPWPKTFLRNLRDLLRLRKETPWRVVRRPGMFWDDVFVVSPLPWRQFAESAVAHAGLIALLVSVSILWPPKETRETAAVFHSSDVVYYSATEYLQPLDTGGRRGQSPP